MNENIEDKTLTNDPLELSTITELTDDFVKENILNGFSSCCSGMHTLRCEQLRDYSTQNAFLSNRDSALISQEKRDMIQDKDEFQQQQQESDQNLEEPFAYQEQKHQTVSSKKFSDDLFLGTPYECDFSTQLLFNHHFIDNDVNNDFISFDTKDMISAKLNDLHRIATNIINLLTIEGRTDEINNDFFQHTIDILPLLITNGINKLQQQTAYNQCLTFVQVTQPLVKSVIDQVNSIGAL